jgi:hypothetical protein
VPSGALLIVAGFEPVDVEEAGEDVDPGPEFDSSWARSGLARGGFRVTKRFGWFSGS